MRHSLMKSLLSAAILAWGFGCAGNGEGDSSSVKQGGSTSKSPDDEDSALVVPANMPCLCESLIDLPNRGNFASISNPDSERQHHCTYYSAGSQLKLGVSVVKADKQNAYKWVLESSRRGYNSLEQESDEDLGSNGELQSFIGVGSKSRALIHVVDLKRDGLVIEASELLAPNAPATSHPAYIDALIANSKGSCAE